MSDDHTVLRTLYDRFNLRDIESVLAALHPDVTWPNGWEGGWLHGRDAVRDYWTRQWHAIDPHVEPVGFETDTHGRTVVHVHAVVRDLTGAVVSDGPVDHVYELEGGLVRRMEIKPGSE